MQRNARYSDKDRCFDRCFRDPWIDVASARHDGSISRAVLSARLVT